MAEANTNTNAGNVFSSSRPTSKRKNEAEKNKIIFDYINACNDYRNDPQSQAKQARRSLAFEKIMLQYDNMVYDIINKKAKGKVKLTDDDVKEIRNNFWGNIFPLIETSWDPKKGAFSTFIYNYIKGEASKYINENVHKDSSYFLKLKKKIEAVASSIKLRTGIEPTPVEIAAAIGCKTETVLNTLSHSNFNKQVELDKEDEEGKTPEIDAGVNVESTVINKMTDETMIKIVKKLPKEMQQVVMLKAFKEYSYDKIAEVLNIKKKEAQILFNSGTSILRNDIEMKKVHGSDRKTKEKNTAKILIVEKDAALSTINDLSTYSSERSKYAVSENNEDFLVNNLETPAF